MKSKFNSMWRVAIALVLALSLSLVMAAPVGAAVSQPTVTPVPNLIDTVAEYTIGFETGGTGGLTMNVDTIIVTFTEATTTVPVSYATGDITVNSTNVLDTAVSVVGQVVTITTPVSISASSAVEVIFTTAASIVNPTVAGDYTLSVATSGDGDGTAQDSAAYTITDLPTVTEVQPDSGNAGETMWVEVTGTYFTDVDDLGDPTTTFTFGTGVSVVAGTYHFVTTESVDCQITIDSAATAGAREVTATSTAGLGAATADAFTVGDAGTPQVDVWDSYTPVADLDADTWSATTLAMSGDNVHATIQLAVTACVATEIVIAHAATYGETITIDQAGITLESMDGAASTIIDGTGLDSGVDALVWLQKDDINFKDFTVQNCPRTAGGAALWVAGVIPGISGCVVTENIIAETNESVYSILLTAASTCEVSDNEISNSGLNGVVFSGSEGNCLNNLITLNTVTGSRGVAINLHSGTPSSFAGTVISENIISGGGFGIALGEANGTEGSLIVIRDNDILNVVTGLGESPANGISTNNSSYVDIYGNDIKDGIKGIAVYDTHANVTFRYNDITGNSLYGLDAALATGGDVNAKYNYWGDPSGPTITATNPRGAGDAVTTYVLYEPWLHTTQATVYPSGTRYYAYNWCDLTTGWNIWSTPIALDAQADTWGEYKALGNALVLGSGANAYYFDASTPAWASVTDSYQLSPCDAIYVKVASNQEAPILFSPNISAPAKALYPGWNLVSASYIDNMDSPTIATGIAPEDCLASVYTVPGPYNTGYSQVVSPAVNQTAWTGYRGQTIDATVGELNTMKPCKGYWVYMTNGGTLAGAVFTPVSPLQ